MEKQDYTAREVLEIKGIFFYFVIYAAIVAISITFQFLARVNFRNIVVTVFSGAVILSLCFILYRKKQQRRESPLLKWAVALFSVTTPILSRFNYAATMDWTYAAQSYQLVSITVGVIVMLQFLYDRKIYIFISLLYFTSWIVFLALASAQGVTFYSMSMSEGKWIHDGVLWHREIYFFLMMGIIAFASYRNIPIMRDYDLRNEKQRVMIGKQAAAQRETAREVSEKMGDLLLQVNRQSAVVAEFNDKIQNQASTFEEISATMEELQASSDSISQSAMVQLDENRKMDDIIRQFRSTKEETKNNLDVTLSRIGSVVEKTRIGNELLGTVESTIERIGKESGAIADTVNVIVDIADRINLLSLNASIEAARAGDSGRGFAVVADEIGKLAAQTTDSIREIERVLASNTKTTTEGVSDIKSAAVNIKDMISHIEESTRNIKVLQTGIGTEERQIDSIIGQMTTTIQLAGNINVSTSEQKRAITSVTKAVADVNEDMVRMVGGVNEIVESSNRISGDARLLADISRNAVVEQ